MKILAIADAPPNIDLVRVVHEESIDVVITLGDLMRGDLKGLERVIECPKIGVYGNHDSHKYMPAFGIEDIHLKTKVIQGNIVLGIEGCVAYKHSIVDPMYSQEEMFRLLQFAPLADIVVTHCPPKGCNDDEGVHQGWEGLLAYVERCRPKLLLHGHTHPRLPVSEFKGTHIEYVYGHKIIQF